MQTVCVHGVTKKPMLCLLAVTDENGHPLEDEDESGMKLCNCWGKVFELHIQEERHHSHQTILDYVQRAPDDIQWQSDQFEFDEMMATMIEPALGPDEIPKSIFWCAGGLGSQFLFDVYKRVLEGCAVPTRIRCKQDRLHSQVFHCRRQWSHCEAT